MSSPPGPSVPRFRVESIRLEALASSLTNITLGKPIFGNARSYRKLYATLNTEEKLDRERVKSRKPRSLSASSKAAP